MPLAHADFILNPKSVVPVAVDLMRPDRVGLDKFVETGTAGGLTKAGKGIGKAGMSGKWASTFCALLYFSIISLQLVSRVCIWQVLPCVALHVAAADLIAQPDMQCLSVINSPTYRQHGSAQIRTVLAAECHRFTPTHQLTRIVACSICHLT